MKKWVSLGVLLLSPLFIFGCDNHEGSFPPGPGPRGVIVHPDIIETLEQSSALDVNAFGSDEEFAQYVEKIGRGREVLNSQMASSPSNNSDMAASPGAGASSAGNGAATGTATGTGAAESITNNQEQGVDEGDIVKAYKEYLVVLRRGRLFALRVGGAGGAALAAVSRIDAYPKGSTMGTWYDEMLIHGDRIVVVGYSYEIGATEIGLFSISPEGKLAHVSTHFLRSNDYYSSRNYASRLVGSSLVFYMPSYLFGWFGGYGSGAEGITLPGMAAFRPGSSSPATRCSRRIR